MSAYKQQTQLRQTVVENVGDFWKKWRVIFEKWRTKINNDQEQIVAWYNRPKACPSPAHSFSLLAFPCVNFEEVVKKTITESIQVSTMRWVYHHKEQWIQEWRARYNVGSAIMKKLKGMECHFYGSSMLGLNEDYSDIDIYASDSNFQNISEALKVIDLKATARKKPHACVSLT